MKFPKIIFVVPPVLLGLALVLSSNFVFLLFILSILVLLINFLWAFFNSRGIRLEAGPLPDHSQVGESFTREITVFNDSRAPKPLLKLEEETNLPGYNNLAVLNLKSRSNRRWQESIECKRRGLYRIGPAVATVGDLFGIFSKKYVFGKPTELLVYPEMLDLPSFEVSAPGALENSSSSWLMAYTGANASTIREFVNGDSLRHVHWPSTARTGKLMVKVFENDRVPRASRNVCIVVDMQESAHLGQDNETTEEYAVTIAASLVKKYLDADLRVGLLLSNAQLLSIPADKGEQHFHRMLRALTLVKADGNKPIERVASGIRQLDGETTAIIVSPSTNPRLADSVRELKLRGILAAVVLLDNASFGASTDSAGLARALNLLGTQTYVVRKGDELIRALTPHNISIPVTHI